MQYNIPKFDLNGKTALVTGGAGILGQYFATALATYGAQVIIIDNNKKAAEEFCDNSEFDIKALTTDISDEAAVKDAISQIESEYGKIDILHNNAATKSSKLEEFFKDIFEFDMKYWDEIMKINLDAMFVVARNVAKSMIKNKVSGSIIQTASIYGIMGPDQRIYEGSQYNNMEINTPAIYSASKAGVVGLTKYLATYLAKNNIRVNSLTPGGVKSGQNDIFEKKYSARIPLGRMAEANEMVGALVFLASDASSYITGQNIIIDGGLSSW